MTLETEYRGYSIRYSENNDTWVCYDCGIDGEPTLKKAKEKIDKLHLKLRKAAAVECREIEIVTSGREMGVRATESRIIDYLGPKEERSWSGNETVFKGHRVAAVAHRRGREKATRREVMLHSLAAISPEVDAAILRANELAAAARHAVALFEEAAGQIPKLQIEDIPGLVEASQHRFEEGSD